jgi:chromate transport protein ChrA
MQKGGPEVISMASYMAYKKAGYLGSLMHA